jgi:hypothetical protein
MKAHSVTLLVLFLSALFFAGCGKSSQQKQMEGDLNKRVMQLHDSGMVKMRQAQGLESQLDSTKVLSDSLAAKFPGDAAGHGSDDISQAKERLSIAEGAMHAWMAGHKPYDPEGKHDDAMTQLNADIQELMNVSTQLDTAIVDATGTIENHRKYAAELLAKKPVKKGKK